MRKLVMCCRISEKQGSFYGCVNNYKSCGIIVGATDVTRSGQVVELSRSLKEMVIHANQLSSKR